MAQSASLDPTDPEEFGEIITQCSQAVKRATCPNFIGGAQIADRYWDGNLGARAAIISVDTVETKEDRIQRFVESGQVNLGRVDKSVPLTPGT